MNSPPDSGFISQRSRNRLVNQLRDEGISDERVLELMRRIPRHHFVDEALAHQAYDNRPLGIGHGQTISQPYIVAKMTELLMHPTAPRRVLEIGTGCGYQTAFLSFLCEQVYTVERILPLQREARRRLYRLGIGNVHYHHGDGYQGWTEQAPYDGILCAAAAEREPEALLEQLATGGRLVLPLGDAGSGQWLRCIQRQGRHLERSDHECVRFVPMLPGIRS